MTTQPIQQASIPLSIGPSNRNSSLSSDAIPINVFFEKQPDGVIDVIKRPCFVFQNTVAPGSASGIYYSQFYEAFIIVAGGTVYLNATSVGTVAHTAPASMVDYGGNGASSQGTFILLSTLGPGNAYIYPYGGGLTAVGLSFTGPVPGVCFLDGTVYAMSGAGGIYNSNINDPTTWVSTNVIYVSSRGQGAVALAQQKVYIVALCPGCVEVFYDAGNATGSPLSPVPGGFASIGCLNSLSVVSTGDTLTWLGVSPNGEVAVYSMHDLQTTRISTAAVERLLPLFTGGTAAPVVIAGHIFYVLNGAANFSLAYDLTEGYWLVWNLVPGVGLPFLYGAAGTSGPSTSSSLVLMNGYVLQVSTSAYQDSFTDVITTPSVALQTPNWDGGTRFKKLIKSVDLIGDANPTTCTLSHSDDDYNSWSTPRTINLAASVNGSPNRPVLENCGTTRRRAFQLVHNDNTPFRASSLQLSYELGNL